jgi:hypothetical protein
MFGSLQDIGIFLGRMGFDSKQKADAVSVYFSAKWLKLTDKTSFVARIPCINHLRLENSQKKHAF